MKNEELVNATIKALTEGVVRKRTKKTETKKVEEKETSLVSSYDFKNDKTNPIWIVGTVTSNGKTYKVNAKVFLEGSEFGIDNGPISKLWIQGTDEKDYKPVVNYDRGWDIEPSEENKALYNEIMKLLVDFRNANPYEVDETQEPKTESIDYLKAAKQINDISTEEIVKNLVKNNDCDKRLRDIAKMYDGLSKYKNKLELDDDKYIELDNKAEKIIAELAGVDLLDLEESKKIEETVRFTAYGKTYYEMTEEEYDNKSDEEIQNIIIDTADQATEEEGHTVETDEVEILFESKEIKTESYNNDELKELLNKGEILKVGQTQFKIDNGEVYFNDPSWTFGWDKHNGLSNVDELVNHLSNLQSDKYKITVEPKEKKEKTSDEMYELTKNTKVKDWYKDTFPSDELGNNINPNITFYDVFETLDHYKDIYELLGVDDSAIRERVFYGLDDMIDEPHGYSYEQWQLASKTTESKEIKTESKDVIDVEEDISKTFNPSFDAFVNNFGKIYIIKDKYDKLYKVYKEDKLGINDYIYYADNKEQILGLLDGAIKANNGVFNK